MSPEEVLDRGLLEDSTFLAWEVLKAGWKKEYSFNRSSWFNSPIHSFNTFTKCLLCACTCKVWRRQWWTVQGYTDRHLGLWGFKEFPHTREGRVMSFVAVCTLERLEGWSDLSTEHWRDYVIYPVTYPVSSRIENLIQFFWFQDLIFFPGHQCLVPARAHINPEVGVKILLGLLFSGKETRVKEKLNW